MEHDVHSQTLTAQRGECKTVHPPETYTLQVNTKEGFRAPWSTFGVGRASVLTASRDPGSGLPQGIGFSSLFKLVFLPWK